MIASGTSQSAVYLDSSALVKLLTPEPETPALQSFLRERPRQVTSVLARIEVTRAAHRLSPDHVVLAQEILTCLAQLTMAPQVVSRAAQILPGQSLRSLDAIHIASALVLPDLEALVTYDLRMASAADILGIPIAAPS